MTERDTTAAAENLAHAAERYLLERYPSDNLMELIGRRIQAADHGLAFTLRAYRIAAGWPEPEELGEIRCVGCHKVMGDEQSIAEDETVCAKCAAEDPLP